MKAYKVLKLLNITRPTLTSYVKTGKIKTKTNPNGFYDYDEESVYALLGVENRDVAIYCRVSTPKQEDKLYAQIERVTQFATEHEYNVTKTYKDIGSGFNFERTGFRSLLNDVMKHKIKTVIISNKDRLALIGFDTWKCIFDDYNCEIIVINDIEDDDKGIFSDIISLLHELSIKMYSKRNKRKIEIIKEDLEIEECY